MTNMAACLKTLADAYAMREAWKIEQGLKCRFRDQVEHWFSKIPVEIRWISDLECPQPFQTMEEMKAYWMDKGVLLMLSEDSEALGRDCYSKHRAIHDWFGHIEPGLPFGGEGESKSFLVHVSQYEADCLPIVFSDVVLSNAYAGMMGHPFGAERWVYAPDLIGSVEDTFK